ncbi:MAG: tRNA (uridine(34)/cytosine(34)/5-carboxymethylaminomethyluridine(34)-2'-O)-methyltransferase TrmL [Spirochaetia bacterium]|nr:tRNA (uridine(34)/cytosine(34)/5-carboxymethylaminomethyluridine(34)-2'-O)-methyltransferase TrmL [Spirochaetia bacterium]
MNLNVVLVEPEIPQNTGNIVRTCAATGARLHLIKPLGFSLEDRYLKRAGLDYWPMAEISLYEDLNEFYAKNGNCGCFYVTTKGLNNYAQVSYPNTSYVFFGKETRGLPEELLAANKDSCIRIPMLPGTRSLNLSNSVAIVVYEMLRQKGFDGLQMQGRLTRYDWASL